MTEAELKTKLQEEKKIKGEMLREGRNTYKKKLIKR